MDQFKKMFCEQLCVEKQHDPVEKWVWQWIGDLSIDKIDKKDCHHQMLAFKVDPFAEDPDTFMNKVNYLSKIFSASGFDFAIRAYTEEYGHYPNVFVSIDKETRKLGYVDKQWRFEVFFIDSQYQKEYKLWYPLMEVV